MIRLVLAVLLLCLLCFMAGEWWEANPRSHPQVFSWVGKRIGPRCPADWTCIPNQPK